MKTSLLRLAFTLFSVILFEWSCKPIEDLSVAPTNQVISVAEAKQHYVSWSLPNARANKTLQGRQPVWSRSVQTQFKNGVNVVITPVLYNYGMKLSFYQNDKKKKDASDFAVQTKLLTYKDRSGGI